MPRLKAILFLVSIVFSTFSFSQKNSWDGWQVAPRGEIRMLNFFVNIIYDVNPDKEKQFAKVNDWNTVLLEGINQNPPNYLRKLFDTEYDSKNLYGCITRLYGESSFYELKITGDFVVVNIKESQVLKLGAFNENNIEHAVVKFINERGGLQTMYGHDDIAYYDYGNKGEVGFVEFFFRNITKQYGGDDAGNGYFTTSILRGEKILIGGKYYSFSGLGTAQCVGTRDISTNPTGIVQHEISHSFFGPNSFHTSGGNHRRSSEYMPFLGIQGGYGLMGGAGSGLVSCNGYERLRMHWLHESNRNNNGWWIVARNQNDKPINADIAKDDGTQTFILRDFVTYGDAIRIKLPYKDSDKASNQYIWIENHQSGRNGKLDFLQYSNESECRPQDVSGVYMYYQVGRDVLSGTQSEVFFSNERDNLRVIPAEGYWNYKKLKADTAFNMRCISWSNHTDYYSREEENPFGGCHDQERMFFPPDEAEMLSTSFEKAVGRKTIGRQIIDSLAGNGDARDMFCTHAKLNMGTNPSTCNTRTYYTSMSQSKCEYKSQSARNNQTTYLSGLGIEITPLDNGNYRIDVRWDDYEITSDAIWTGRIALREKAVLAEKKEILLTQNKMPAQAVRDSISHYFAKPTEFVCENGSEFIQQSGSSVMAEDLSTLILEGGSTYRIEGKSRLKIDKTSKLVLGGTLIVGDGAQVIIKNKNGLVDVGGKILIEGRGKVKY